MNWGYKILIAYITFVLGILFLVFRSSSERVDLVSNDYYAQELRYQQTIDQTNRANALTAAVTYEFSGNQLFIHFPADFSGKKITGSLVLYCPADQDRDLRKEFAISDSVFSIKIPPKVKGRYELQLKWQAGGLDYYFVRKIFI